MARGTHHATLGGAELVYHVIGSGPPLIVLSGGPGASWAYMRLPASIAEHATLIHLELVGTGDSARLADPSQYSRARDVADVLALREHLGLDEVALLGHSYGGFVAQELALEHPELVDRLILYDTSPTTGEDMWTDMNANVAARAGEPWFDEATQALASAESATTDDEINAIFARLVPLYFHTWPFEPPDRDAVLASLRFSVDRANRGTSSIFDFRPRLGEISQPTLVVVGVSDFICSPRMAAQLHAGIPGSRLVVLERSGHFGHWEQPEEFARAVIEFLDADR